MFNNLIALFVVAVFIIALLFLFVGHRIIMVLPTVRRLHCIKDKLSALTFVKPIARGTSLKLLCRRLIADYALTQNQVKLAGYDHQSIGNAILIVHYHSRNLMYITKELRTYAFLVTVLGTVGFLKCLSLTKFVFSFQTIWSAAGDNPFQIVALFELLMLVFFLIRLIIEVHAIKETLEE